MPVTVSFTRPIIGQNTCRLFTTNTNCFIPDFKGSMYRYAVGYLRYMFIATSSSYRCQNPTPVIRSCILVQCERIRIQFPIHGFYEMVSILHSPVSTYCEKFKLSTLDQCTGFFDGSGSLYPYTGLLIRILLLLSAAFKVPTKIFYLFFLLNANKSVPVHLHQSSKIIIIKKSRNIWNQGAVQIGTDTGGSKLTNPKHL